jgi:hypothetical protein
MKKGQLSLEATAAAAMIMFIFGTTVGIASNMQEEATDRLIMKAAKMRCIGLANILEEISANGPGASVSFAVMLQGTIVSLAQTRLSEMSASRKGHML